MAFCRRMTYRILSGRSRCSSITSIPSFAHLRQHSHARTDWKPWTGAAFVAGVLAAIPADGLPFELPKTALLALGACIGIAGILAERADCLGRLRRSRIGQAGLAFFLIAILSPAWSVAPLQSIVGASARFEGAFAYILYFAWMLIGMHMASTPQGRRYVEYTLLAAASGVVLYGILQILHLDPLQSQWQSDVFLGRNFSTLGQPNALGLWLLLVVPIVSRYMIRAAGAARILAAGLVIGSCILLLATVSRAAFFGLVAMIILGVWWHRSRVKKFRWPHWAAALTASIVVLGLGSCFAQVRFSTAGEDTRSQSSRILLWNAAVRMIAHRPYGYGPDTLGLVSSTFLSPEIIRYEPLTVRIDRAHSQIFDLALSLGIAGAVIFYLFVLSLIATATDANSRPHTHDPRPYALALAGSSLCLLFVFHTVTTAVTFFFITGVTLGLLLPSYKHVRSQLDTLSLSVVLLLLGTLVVGTLCWMRSDLQMARARRALAGNDLQAALVFSAQGVHTFPFDRVHLIDALELQLDLVTMTDDAELTRQAGRHITRELMLLEQLTGGTDGFAYLLAAWKTALQGDRILTEAYLAKASVHSPGRVTYLRIAAHCFALLGDRAKVARARALLIELLPPDWRNPTSVPTRILLKENPWLSDITHSNE